MKTNEGNSYVRIHYEPILEKTITFTGTIKTSSIQCSLSVFEINSGIINSANVLIPKDSSQNFSISLTTSDQNEEIILQCFNYSDVFLDNLNLKTQ